VSASIPLPKNFAPAAVADVENRLAARWQAPGSAGNGAVHACTLNLIACVEDANDTAAVSDVVGRLAATHPIRAITIVTEESADPNQIRAWIGSNPAGGSAGQISSEEIALLAQTDDTEPLVATVEGMLAADLPVYFWWRGGSPTGDHTFAALARLADKIIVDSIRFGDAAAALDTIRGLLAMRAGRAGVSDLNWIRTAPWRESIAACFDDAAVLALLPHMNRASINYYASGSTGALAPSARALLLSHWLTNRVPRLRGRVRIKPVAGATAGIGRVVKVSLSSATSPTALELERVDDPVGVAAVAKNDSGEILRAWTFPAETLSEAELMHRSIEAPARDPVLEAALRTD